MKILIITASLNERSGWGRYSLAVIKELKSLGHDVTVLSEEKSSTYLKKMHSRFSLLTLARNAILARKLARSVDVVHALDGWPYGVYGYIGVLGTNKGFFMNGVGTYSVAPLYESGSAFLLRSAYRRAAKVFCISSYTRSAIIAAGISEQKVITVHMGAPELPMLAEAEAVTMARKAGIPESAYPMILTVGSIKDRKGQFDTLKAVELLKQNYPEVLYVLAGSGNQKDYIASIRNYAAEHGLTDNIRIFTDADDRTISSLYGRCSVFALNSNSDLGSHHFEGFGLVVIEAAEHGKPSVGSRNSGVEDAIDDGKTGFLTNQHDPEDIANKIRQILERYDFFTANAKMWHSKFTWKKTVERYIQAYAER